VVRILRAHGDARTVLIVNPQSQGGRLGKRWKEIADTIGRAFPFEEAITQGPDDATRLPREALRGGAERVVAIGGDGTINEVVNGFFDASGAAIALAASFAVIPFGTGGDFRRTVQMPIELADAAAVIAANHRKRIDVGRLEFTATGGGRALRMFANIASFGVSGVVDRLVNESSKRLGRLAFAVATARATWSYKNQRVQLVFDGADRVEVTINTVAAHSVRRRRLGAAAAHRRGLRRARRRAARSGLGRRGGAVGVAARDPARREPLRHGRAPAARGDRRALPRREIALVIG
jgi:diacylglycerol kinase family enzyme